MISEGKNGSALHIELHVTRDELALVLEIEVTEGRYFTYSLHVPF